MIHLDDFFIFQLVEFKQCKIQTTYNYKWINPKIQSIKYVYKMKTKFKIISIITFLFTLLLFGCSNNLNRKMAEEILRKEFSFPDVVIKPFCVYDATLSNSLTLEDYKKLEKEGVITYSICGSGLNRGYCATLTEEGKRNFWPRENNSGDMFTTYINVLVAFTDFGEITGIVENKENNLAAVNYTIKYKDITPFGRILFNIKEGDIPKSVTLRKYDDGWRIE